MEKIRIIIKYINYYFTAKSKYKIHSPFVYDLLINVIYYFHYEDEFDSIEEIRENLLKDNRKIKITDHGAKSNRNITLKKIKNITKSSSKSIKYSQLLFRLVKHFEPRTMIELGTSFGISTLYQAFAAEKGKIVTIEGSQEIANIARENFKKLKLWNIDLIVDNFDNVLPEILKELDVIDYVFFDGNHRKESTINYFKLCLQKANSESVFIFDDIHWSKGMEEAWEYIKNHKKVTLTIDLFFLGLVFFRKNIIKQDHVIRF
jgi:predicted O-methyltransferase YrrM